MLLKDSNFKNLLFASYLVTFGVLLPHFTIAMEGSTESTEHESLLRKNPDIYHTLKTREYRDTVNRLRQEIQQLYEQKKAAKTELPLIEKERKEFQIAIEKIEKKRDDRMAAYEAVKMKHPNFTIEEAQRYLRDEIGKKEDEIARHRKYQSDPSVSLSYIIKAWEEERNRVAQTYDHLMLNMETIDFDLRILQRKLEQLNIQIHADPIGTTEKKIGQKIFLLEKLYEEHVKTPEGNSILSSGLAKIILESLGIESSSTMHLDSHALATYFARTMELPCVMGMGEPRKKAYLEQTQLIIDSFAQRIAEELDVLLLLDSIIKGQPLVVNLDHLPKEIVELLTRGATFPALAGGHLNPEIALLQQILGPTINTKNLEAILDEADHGLLGLCIDSLTHRPPHCEPRNISRSILLKTHIHAEQATPESLAAYYVDTVLSILASHINKILLERIIEDCKIKPASLPSSQDGPRYY